MKSFILNSLTTYKYAVYLSIFLSVVGMAYLFFTSPYTPLFTPFAHYIFYGIFLITALQLYTILQKKDAPDTLTTFTIAFVPLAGIFATVTHLIDAIVPSIVYMSGLLGAFLLSIWIIRYALHHIPSHNHNTSHIITKEESYFSARTTAFIVLILTLIFLILGLHHIGKQTLVDEPLWMFDRIERYWNNFAEGDLRHTRPSDKPGVTVSFLSGTALLHYPAPSTLKETITPETREHMLTWMRAPIVIFVAMLLPLFFHVTRRLFGTNIALTSLTFTALSPLLLGMTRMINPDALLWILLPLTLLLFSSVLLFGHKRSIVLTGIFLGLAILTKYVANVLFVFLPIMIVLYEILATTQPNYKVLYKNLRVHFYVFAIITLTAITTFIILLPSTWVHPLHILTGTIWSQAFAPLWIPFTIFVGFIYLDLFVMRRSLLTALVLRATRFRRVLSYLPAYGILAILLFTFVSAYLHMPFDYQLALRSPKSALHNVGAIGTFFADFYVLLFGINIIALPSTLFALYVLPHKATKHHHTRTALLIILLLFIPFYYIGSLFGNVAATMRYQVALFPIIFLIAAYGITQILYFAPQATRKILFVAIFILLTWSLLYTMPFYQSYANRALPHGDILTIKDMGDGSYQAAQFLNALPHAADLSIWADKSGVCAAFVGACTTTVDVTRIAQESIVFDYYVTSSGREHLTTRNARHKRGKKSAPANAPHFERLYTEPFTPTHKIILAHNPVNAMTIFAAHNVNLRP